MLRTPLTLQPLKQTVLTMVFCAYSLFGLLSLSPQTAHADSLEQAVEQVKRNTNGKILSAKTSREGKRNVHNIRVLTKQGRVKRFRVDARSGQFIRK